MKSVKVWDFVVRFCHWALAACVIANLAITEEGSPWHQYIGYAAAGIVMFRLFWGFVGSRHARFTDFFPTPARLKAHGQRLLRREPDPHLGHNPFAALMMLTLWAIIMAIAASGYLMLQPDMLYGGEWLEELHEALAESLMPLIALHVAAAVLMSWWQKTNLLSAMVTGKKHLPEAQDTP